MKRKKRLLTFYLPLALLVAFIVLPYGTDRIQMHLMYVSNHGVHCLAGQEKS